MSESKNSKWNMALKKEGHKSRATVDRLVEVNFFL
jgi:hypothetical protein